jgi:tRNA(fMet)-specific endonuclease VapC
VRVLLDTSAYSALGRGHRDVADMMRTATSIALNAVVLAELLGGFGGGSREARNRRKLEEFLDSPRVRLLPIGRETAERFASIQRMLRQVGTPIPTQDMWIAASAVEHALHLVTTDRHFTLIPLLPVELFAVQ